MDVMHTKLSTPIHAGIVIVLQTLNHYYSLMDSSDVYQIAMEYFKDAGWEEEWTHTTENAVEVAHSDIEFIKKLPKYSNMFDNMPSLAPLKAKDSQNELDQFLKANVKHVADALGWWTE
ncbi:hypothetical protein JVU11DRAFT_10600 [Chiua virens]|nr:hypothetical protein JVU11DRAFT_10600 [Chiua virens]